jgi:hypothetical protein
MSEVTRRDLLRGLGAIAAAAGLAGCSGRSAGSARTASAAAGHATPSGAAASTRSRPAAAGLPRTSPWTPRPGEVAPSVKARATRLVEAAGAWSAGQAGPAAAQRRIAALGFAPGLVDQLSPLLGDGTAAVVQVVDAQYGGILAAGSSVLVVTDQWVLRRDGSVAAGGTTFDVRLVAATPRWRATEVHPAHPGAAAASLSAAARAVLHDGRIHLPHAAAADVRSGQVHDSVLHALTALAAAHVLDVSVVRSGHPLYVFGTRRPSDHPHGRAVDVWAVDGHPVVLPANRTLVASFMRSASRVGPWQVGGPVDLDGSGTAFFSDATHQDHVHMGFRT